MVSSTRGSVLAHRHLPRVELALLAAHRDDHDERERQTFTMPSTFARLPTPLDCMQHRLLAAEPRAGGEADAFFLGW